jgi:hypothetical protein
MLRGAGNYFLKKIEKNQYKKQTYYSSPEETSL